MQKYFSYREKFICETFLVSNIGLRLKPNIIWVKLVQIPDTVGVNWNKELWLFLYREALEEAVRKNFHRDLHRSSTHVDGPDRPRAFIRFFSRFSFWVQFPENVINWDPLINALILPTDDFLSWKIKSHLCNVYSSDS